MAKSWTVSPAFLKALFLLTGALTTISGIHYILQALRGAAQPQNPPG
jgi:hypothetical protein